MEDKNKIMENNMENKKSENEIFVHYNTQCNSSLATIYYKIKFDNITDLYVFKNKRFYEILRGDVQRLFFDFDFNDLDKENLKIDYILEYLNYITKIIGKCIIMGYTKDYSLYEQLLQYDYDDIKIIMEFKENVSKYLSLHATFYESSFNRNDLFEHFKTNSIYLNKAVQNGFKYDPSTFTRANMQKVIRHSTSNKIVYNKILKNIIVTKIGISLKLVDFNDCKNMLVTCNSKENYYDRDTLKKIFPTPENLDTLKKEERIKKIHDLEIQIGNVSNSILDIRNFEDIIILLSSKKIYEDYGDWIKLMFALREYNSPENIKISLIHKYNFYYIHSDGTKSDQDESDINYHLINFDNHNITYNNDKIFKWLKKHGIIAVPNTLISLQDFFAIIEKQKTPFELKELAKLARQTFKRIGTDIIFAFDTQTILPNNKLTHVKTIQKTSISGLCGKLGSLYNTYKIINNGLMSSISINTIIKYFLDDNSRYKSIALYSTNPEIYSIFEGFNYNIEYKESMQNILKLKENADKLNMLWLVLNNITDDKIASKYVRNWLRWRFRNLEMKPKTALIFSSLHKQIGKNVFWNIICSLFGNFAKSNIPNLDYMVGNFNILRQNSFLSIINEITSNSKDINKYGDAMKTMITEMLTIINKKGIDASTEVVYDALVFLSNNFNILRIEENDVRYSAFRSNKLPLEKSFYGDIINIFSLPEYKQLLINYFLYSDYEEVLGGDEESCWNVPYNTDYKKDLEDLQKDIYQYEVENTIKDIISYVLKTKKIYESKNKKYILFSEIENNYKYNEEFGFSTLNDIKNNILNAKEKWSANRFKQSVKTYLLNKGFVIKRSTYHDDTRNNVIFIFEDIKMNNWLNN